MPQNSDPYSVFILDDDREMRASLTDLLERSGWDARSFHNGKDALKAMADTPPDAIVSDVRMPAMSGIQVLAEVTKLNGPPVVLISAHGDIPMAVDAMQNGAYTFLEKPFDPRRLITALTHAAEQNRLAARAKRLSERLRDLSGLDRVLLGETEAIARLREDILDFADVEASVLVQGETGTGKELVARALHDLSRRAGAPFVALSCAALPAEHFEATLFGTTDQSGLLASAEGGSLFLDELASCPIEVQAKLLRVLETREYFPIGSAKPRKTDVRLISASKVDLAEAVANGAFRDDLFFRVNALLISLPPLRERKDDLLLLFAPFCRECAETYETTPPQLTTEDISTLLAHDWPGNVRELRHVAERFVLASRRGPSTVAAALRQDKPEENAATLRHAVAALEKQLIAQAIKTHQGRMDSAAEALGIGRRTLNEKIVKLGLDKDTIL
ncbi:sigma-54-dependent transcriptional regulator [Falsihalocynthiibacter sp. SS001]|uniref:sigma-54-dependent transcriptional regulator n=1 Tax=Falsihalocynthiibacter sp. SS001 TaxID=3349698 RepID=UPI0036D2BCAD